MLKEFFRSHANLSYHFDFDAWNSGPASIFEALSVLLFESRLISILVT